jgi:hypothetical protein
MKTCFVVQGFGKKTDYTDGRVLDLDASYEVIKEAVEAAELECVRADEIIHSGTINAAPAAVTDITGEDNPSSKVMLDSALEKIKASDFMAARILLEEVKKLRPKESFVLQQLALATYKSKQPTDLEALQNALRIMQELSPETSNNPETVGLWGAIHKRLWELSADPRYLNESISAYERGFYLKQDYYNGINLAYLLNLRAVEFLKSGNRDEAVADFVLARRIRREVIRYTTPLLDSMEDITNRYWLIATLYEAAVGIGDEAAIVNWETKAKAMNVDDWMQETRINQAEKLKKLMQEYKDRLV